MAMAVLQRHPAMAMAPMAMFSINRYMPCIPLETLLCTETWHGHVYATTLCTKDICDLCLHIFLSCCHSVHVCECVYAAQHADQADKQQSITSTPPAAWCFEGLPWSGGLQDTLLCILAAKFTTAEMSVNKQAFCTLCPSAVSIQIARCH